MFSQICQETKSRQALLGTTTMCKYIKKEKGVIIKYTTLAIHTLSEYFHFGESGHSKKNLGSLLLYVF